MTDCRVGATIGAVTRAVCMRATSAAGIGRAASRTGRPLANAFCGIDMTAFGALELTNVWL
jgi:hypothetical protein